MDWTERFQEAAFDPSQWNIVLREMAAATGSARGQLIGIGGANAIPFNWVTDFPDEALADFVAMDGGSPAVNFRTAADRDPATGAIAHEADYRRAGTTLRTHAYFDFCHRYEIPFGCHSILLAEDGAMVGLAALRTEQDGRTTEADRIEFARATQAARTAIRFQRAIEHQGVALLAGAMDAIGADCFLIDGFGRVGAMTPGAERRVAAGQALTLAWGRLGNVVADVARQIDLGLQAVLAGQGHARIPLGQGQRLDLFGMRPRDWTISFAPRVIGVVRDAGADMAAQAGFIAATYGLSPAEAAVAGLLARGRDRATIAADRGVSPETLKSQIKALYQKTGCSREAELVALLAGLSG